MRTALFADKLMERERKKWNFLKAIFEDFVQREDIIMIAHNCNNFACMIYFQIQIFWNLHKHKWIRVNIDMILIVVFYKTQLTFLNSHEQIL